MRRLGRRKLARLSRQVGRPLASARTDKWESHDWLTATTATGEALRINRRTGAVHAVPLASSAEGGVGLTHA